MESNKNPKIERSIDVEQRIRRRTFISFGVFFGMSSAAVSAWKWLVNSPDEIPTATGNMLSPLRNALNKSESVFRNFFSDRHLAKTYSKDEATLDVRVNGLIGIEEDPNFDPVDWKLHVVVEKQNTKMISLAEIEALPKTEIVFDFKCVEGWDQIQYWGGVKLSDFLRHFNLNKQQSMGYIGLETPNKGYYVGLDMESALHPQTILAYEMNGKPLSLEHGAPLRLIVPVKYGIKNLKRIGTMSFSNERPKDYWAEQGYDYYSGL